jgi:formate/nitrite transporter
MSLNFAVVLVGNLLGSLFVAYFLAVKTGVVTGAQPLARLATIADAKALTETDWQIFLRAIGCNWLVCLAVWMALAADDIGGKVLAIFFPIMAFVAMGFDHVVANMFFLPAAIFAHVPGIGWGDVLNNWVFAFIGNLVGAAVFVAGAYWYLYGRPAGGEPTAGGVRAADRARDGADGRATREGVPVA